MPTLANLFRHYLPIRFGGGLREVIAGVNRTAPGQTFHPVGLQDFLALQVPPREMLLAPILPERSLAMLYAPRGMGKSLIALTMGLAVASGGSVVRWSALQPRWVLLVDGEMVLSDLQTRLNLILAGLGTKIPNDGFGVLAADHIERGINLSTGEGQHELERHLDWCRLADPGQSFNAAGQRERRCQRCLAAHAELAASAPAQGRGRSSYPSCGSEWPPAGGQKSRRLDFSRMVGGRFCPNCGG
jgi:AAA domain